LVLLGTFVQKVHSYDERVNPVGRCITRVDVRLNLSKHFPARRSQFERFANVVVAAKIRIHLIAGVVSAHKNQADQVIFLLKYLRTKMNEI
jgi:hypothetical protein